MNLLVPLNALLEYRSVTAAADHLGIAQPTMSKHLAQLRKILNDKLLVRVGSHMQLTPTAHNIQATLSGVLSGLNDIFAASYDPLKDKREFIIACPDYVSVYIMPDVIKPYLHDESQLSFHIINWDVQARSLLLEGLIDFVITIDEDFAPNFIRKVIDKDDWVMVMSEKHPLANKETITMEEFLAQPHAQTITGGGSSKQIDRYLKNHQLKRNVRLITQGYIQMYVAIRDSELISVVPKHQAANMAKDFGLTYRSLPFDVAQSQHSVYWHEKFNNDSSHQWFRDHIINEIVNHPCHRVD
ncbi:LysR family transcriptional regulator [Vibrio nitrifigilis]|nr:LysR family transcriptional regulator [Vibrio nitrifigilis]MBF8999865.1 LysR family transcriptional regulator [Vibrio nitrifigilis]